MTKIFKLKGQLLNVAKLYTVNQAFRLFKSNIKLNSFSLLNKIS